MPRQLFHLLFVVIYLTHQEAVTAEVVYSWNCSFDNGWCGMINSANDNFNWQRQKGATPSSSTGPDEDHTGGGFYAYIETSSPRVVKDVAKLTYPFRQYLDRGCVSLFYHMYGKNIGSLQVELRDGTRTKQSWKRFSDRGMNWLPLQLTIQYPIDSLVIQADVGNGYSGDIAIDDVNVTSAPCSYLPLNCSFQRDFCGWQQDDTDDSLDWQLARKHSTFSGRLYPSSGRLGNNDYYVYVDAPGRKPGDAAILTYTLAWPVNSGCFSFYYRMSNSGARSLEVYINNNSTQRLWAISRYQHGWIQQNVTIQQKTHSIQIKAVVDSVNPGDISIDEVSFTTSTCYVAPPPTINCTFEVDTCAWTQSTQDDFDWRGPIAGATDSPATGPSADHTTGKGKYIYIETSLPRVKGEMASLEHTFPSAVNKGCLSLYYHMYGSTIGSLSVVSKDSAGNTKQIWSLSGDQTNQWLPLYVPIEQETLQLRINADLGGEVRGDIAIDDVSFSQYPCEKDSRIVQRMVFEARYPTDCNVLSDPVAKEMVMSSASSHNSLLQGYCGRDCQVNSSTSPQLSCEKEELVIRWPTGKTYSADVSSVPSAFEQRLLRRFSKANKDDFKIVIGTKIPPVVYPVLNKNGTFFGVVLVLECNNGFPLDASKATCG